MIMGAILFHLLDALGDTEVQYGDATRQHDSSSGFDPPALRSRLGQAKGEPLNPAVTTALRSPATTSALARACLCARVAADNKAHDVLVLDMRAITPLYDYAVLSSGTSRRQIHAIAEESDAAMHAEGESRLGIEGYEASKWIVQDYGDVVVHVFDRDTRSYYALEDLWADAPRVDWERY
jgi:ribosome-associated protein